ncbi:MAG TPA: ATP-binding protein [Pyrinomonadaceae bacterium]|nr:ATP-binding protein [Pyrinomonadaceae bacterium]
MSIRGRLLALALGAVVPLVFLGFAVLWVVWGAKEQQLNESLEQQAELAAVVFDRWVDAQRQPLVSVASSTPERRADGAALDDALRAAKGPRAHWVDVRALDAGGRVVASQPAGAESLPAGLAERLLAEAHGGQPAVETDWTRGEGRYVLAVAAPIEGGGAAVARIDGAALRDLFGGVTLPERALVTLLDSNRRVIYRSQTPETSLGLDLSDAEVLSALGERPSAVVTVRSAVDDVERVYGLARAGGTGYVTMVGVPSSILYAPARRQLITYALVSLAVVFCVLSAALLIARSIARPVRLLGFAAEQFGERNFSARAPAEGGDEISRLGASFNSMAERLEQREARMAELDQMKSDFVSSVSHELRTPLTTIKALTRLLMRDGLDESKRREYLDTISVECDRQIDLVLNLLDLSRLEGGVFRLRHERVDVGEIVASCVKSETGAAEKRGHELSVVEGAEVPPACADPKALRRVLSNVIENAIKYTPDGGRIRVSARDGGGEVSVSAEDNGRGIPPEDIPVLFDKFHRGRPARHSEAMRHATTDAEFLEDADVSGVGLGLYLGRNVMEQMGGRISVESEVGRGSTFTLHLPAWREGGCGKQPGEEGGDGKTVIGR